MKQSVRRNIDRFPEDFMFEMTTKEAENFSRSQFVILKRGQNIKYRPFAFTGHGVLMLSNVLRSGQAVQVNIQIMRVCSKMKELLVMHKDILLKPEKFEKKTDTRDVEIKLIFAHIKKLIEHSKKKLKE